MMLKIILQIVNHVCDIYILLQLRGKLRIRESGGVGERTWQRLQMENKN